MRITRHVFPSVKNLIAIAVLVASFGIGMGDARALSVSLPQPDITFSKGYDETKAKAILEVLREQKLQFLGGLYSHLSPDWSTTLVYGEDARALNEFLTALSQIKGVGIKVCLSKDLAKETGSALPSGTWWVRYSHTAPDTVTVRINLAAQELNLDDLEMWLSKAEK